MASRRSPIGTCKQGNCGRPIHSAGYCSTHYSRITRGRPMDAPYYYNVSREVICSFPGCVNDKKAKRLCNAHYQQQARGQKLRPLKVRMTAEGECIQPYCSNKRVGNGLCMMHYKRHRRGGSMDAPYRYMPKRLKYKPCSVKGCEDWARKSGMCLAHGQRWRRGDRGTRLERPLRKCPRRSPSGFSSALTQAASGIDYDKRIFTHREYEPNLPTDA